MYLFLIDSSTGAGKTGDASNISATISLDGGASSASSNSVSEIGGGVYTLTLTQGETNADRVAIIPSSSTASVVGSPIIAYTTGGAVPAAAAGGNGGLPTVDASNHVAGSVTTDALVTTVDSVVDAVKAVTDNLPDAGELSSLATASALSTVDTVVDGLATTLTDVQGSGFDTATDSLEAVRNRGDSSWVTATGFNTTTPPTVEAIADQVWDEATSGHTASGTYGKAIGDGITSWVTATGFNSTTPPTVEAIADQVWDEATSGHTASGTYGKAIGDGITSWVTATGYSVFDAAADAVTVGTVSTAPIDAIADGLLDRANGVEPASAGTERTVRESLRLILSACAGQVAGASGTTITIRDTNDTTNRITATVDSDGNRTAVTYIDS